LKSAHWLVKVAAAWPHSNHLARETEIPYPGRSEHLDADDAGLERPSQKVKNPPFQGGSTLFPLGCSLTGTTSAWAIHLAGAGSLAWALSRLDMPRGG